MEITLRIIPVFAGPLLVGISYTSASLLGYIERYAAFLTLLAAWWLFRGCALRLLDRRRRAPDRRRRALNWAAFLATLLLVTAAIKHFESEFTERELYLVLLVLGLSALRETLPARGKENLALAASFSLYTSVAYLSLHIDSYEWLWPPLLFALGISCLVTAAETAQLIERQMPPGEIPPEQLHPRRLIRAYLFLMVSAPIFVIALYNLGQLGPTYLLFCALYLFLTPLASKLQPGKKLFARPERFAREAQVLSLFGMILLALLRLLA